jgi:hypothetical protein
MFHFITVLWLTLFTLFCGHFMITKNQTPLNLLMHPFTLSVTFIFALIFLKDLLFKGVRLSSVHRCINRHLTMMSQRKIDLAWDGLSWDLRTKLTNQIRLTHGGKAFFGKKRIAHYALRFAQMYQEGNLSIGSVHHVRQTRLPKTMYMVRLRCRATQRVRMTIWISRMPNQSDKWCIDEVCIHPKNGDTQKGHTITGTRMKSSQQRKVKQAIPIHKPGVQSARLSVS